METTDYLYHKQEPEKRSRHDASKRGRPDTRPTPRPSSNKSAARKAVVANVKTFATVTVVMILLLVVAMFISRKTWEMRVAKARESTKTTELQIGAGSAMANKTKDSLMPEPGVDTELRRTVRTELNTDAIRKAVFLAKRGEALAKGGKYDEAIERYREALNVWPYLTEGWAQLGRLYLDTREFARAQIALERAIENDPGSPEILNDLAVSHLYQNSLDKALELFEAVAEIDPAFAPSYFNMALCYLANDDRVRAGEKLDQYLRLRSDDPRALKEKAYLLATDGDYKGALKLLKRALSEAPEWPPLYFDAAASAALLGRVEDALKYLDKSEAMTSPATVYKVFQQPAFREIRLTELGRMFETEMADRARELLSPEALAEATPPGTITEPLSSATPSL